MSSLYLGIPMLYAKANKSSSLKLLSVETHSEGVNLFDNADDQ